MNNEQYKAHRKKLGMTQAQLAEALNVTRKTISTRETPGAVIGTEASLAIRSLTPKQSK